MRYSRYPYRRNSTISVSANINGYETEAVIDSAAMITLIQEEYILVNLHSK